MQPDAAYTLAVRELGRQRQADLGDIKANLDCVASLGQPRLQSESLSQETTETKQLSHSFVILSEC